MSNELSVGCVVCGPDVAATDHKIAEMMFRTGEVFGYRECHGCGSIQIAEVPDDLARHYGGDYYSFETPNTGSSRLDHPIFRTRPALAALRLRAELFTRTGLGGGLWWTRTAGLRTRDRILDIGCGAGTNLLTLQRRGYRHLAGADPFLDADRELAPGVPLWRRRHDDISGVWDWVMMHHAFEHVADPRATLASAGRLLAPGGRVLLRLPLAGGWAWRTYGTNWVQLDPPRHLVLFSLPGLRTLAAEQGFAVDQVVYDSGAFQMWGSEMARQGVAHRAGPDGFFTATQLDGWERRAGELNRALDGDQAMIVLRRA